MEFRETFNYYFRNGNAEKSHASFKIAKPPIMKNNLENKKIRIQKFYVNNLTATPQFIPERVTSSDYFNITTGGASDGFIDNSLTANSLKYYITLRDVGGNDCETVFLRQQLINFGTVEPSGPILDDNVYYNNDYYYYYDFTHFLSLITDAINSAYSSHAGASANPPNPILWQNKDGYFQFFIQNEADWYIELSPSLIELLPFKNIQINDDLHRIVFDPTTVQISGNTYNEVDANFYDTIYPFTQLIFRSEDSNITPINFIDEGALLSNAITGIFEASILTYDISTANFAGVYNFYEYVNENDSLWVNFYTENNSKDNFTVGLYLRMKNNIVIPYYLKQNELCTFTVEIKYNNA